jgi:hypothetical protein
MASTGQLRWLDGAGAGKLAEAGERNSGAQKKGGMKGSSVRPISAAGPQGTAAGPAMPPSPTDGYRPSFAQLILKVRSGLVGFFSAVFLVLRRASTAVLWLLVREVRSFLSRLST